VCLTDTLIRDCNITHNFASGSGGGVYLFADMNAPQIINNLITNNSAGRDGGGISVNWSSNPTIANCTFVGNAAPGLFGAVRDSGFGGGLFCSYESDCTVTDSIFWGNFGLVGSEMAVGTGFEYDPRCATLDVYYTDVRPSPNSVWVDEGCTLNWGEGNISEEPLFVLGPLGNYYLSQRAVGEPTQTKDSPCVDAGSDFASRLRMIRYVTPTGEAVGYTTRTDGALEKGIVDMGYHHRVLEACRICDLVYDGIIDFSDFAVLAAKWRDTGCSDNDDWCSGADLTFDTNVDFGDLMFLVDCWLVADVDGPIPDPSQWEIAPRLTSGSSVSMTAETAFDAWGWDVEYYFECVYGNGHDSGWQESPTYHDTGLAPNTEYGYRVKTRDELGNESQWSVVRYAGRADTTPPAPAPTWEQEPRADAYNMISMRATVANDESGVEYYFESVSGGGHDSGWQDSLSYNDTPVDPNTEYCYRVKARDKSPNRNETPWSTVACVITPLPPDTVAPTPNPMAFDPNGLPQEFRAGPDPLKDYWIEMTAATATDASGVVEYFFECVDDHRYSSGWQAATYYTVNVGRGGLGWGWRVKARDFYGNETAWSREEGTQPEQ